MRKGFTLIEVMVAVVIISVVISALLTLFANNTKIFESFNKKTIVPFTSTLFLGNDFKNLKGKNIHLDDEIKKFDVDDEFRKYVKNINVEVSYQNVAEGSLQDNSGHFESSYIELWNKNISIDDLKISFVGVEIQ